MDLSHHKQKIVSYHCRSGAGRTYKKKFHHIHTTTHRNSTAKTISFIASQFSCFNINVKKQLLEKCDFYDRLFLKIETRKMIKQILKIHKSSPRAAQYSTYILKMKEKKSTPPPKPFCCC